MPANRKPKAWNLKAQMTADPEIWRGMVFFLPLWGGVGPPAALGNGVLFGDSPASWRLTGKGAVSYHDFYPIKFPLSDRLASVTQADHTFGAKARLPDQDNGVLFSIGDGVNWFSITAQSGEMQIQWDDDAIKAVGQVAVDYGGKWVSMFGRRLGNTFYIDVYDSEGNPLIRETHPVNSDYTLLGGVELGGAWWNTTQTVHDAEISWAFASGRYMTDAELKRMATNYDFLQPAGF